MRRTSILPFFCNFSYKNMLGYKNINFGTKIASSDDVSMSGWFLKVRVKNDSFLRLHTLGLKQKFQKLGFLKCALD